MLLFQYGILHTESRKRKFVFLGRETINGNRRLLKQQTCPSMSIGTYQIRIIFPDPCHFAVSGFHNFQARSGSDAI